MRWLVAITGAGPMILAWDKSRRAALDRCRGDGDRFVGLYTSCADACEAARAAPTQEEQAEALVGGLVASVAATRRGAA